MVVFSASANLYKQGENKHNFPNLYNIIILHYLYTC